MPEAGLDALRCLLEALNRGDVSGAIAELDPEIEFEDTDVPDVDVGRGHEAFRGWVAQWGESWASWRFEDVVIRPAGDESAVALFRMIAAGGSSGIELGRDDAVVAKFRDGRVVNLVYYNDQATALTAAGLE